MLSVLIHERTNPNNRKRVQVSEMCWADIKDWVFDNYRGWVAVTFEPAGDYDNNYCRN